MERLAKKVLLIGWDAADWKVINPLIDEGHMPALEKIINHGVMGNNATLEPPFSPMLWTSIATGKYADKHGVLGFTEPDPEGVGMKPVTSLTRKTKAIWNILSQKGFKTHVLGWWPSSPVEAINGIMLSNHYKTSKGKIHQPWTMAPGSVHPDALHDFFAEMRIHPNELTAAHLMPFVTDINKIDQKKDKRLTMIAKSLSEASTLHAAATWIMETQTWDFIAIYLDTIDHFCHGFMRYHPPMIEGVDKEEYEQYKNVVTAAYKFHDMMLETLMNIAGEDTTVIITSDHGFHSDHLRTLYVPDEPAGPAEHHREHGIFCMKGPGVKKDEIVYGTSLLNITPTILTLFGLPLGKDMDGIPVMQAFEKPLKIESIPSWDEVPGNGGMHSITVRRDPLEDLKALQQLIELGYVEDPGPDKQKAAEKAELETKYNLARVYMSNNRYYEAVVILEEIYRLHPDQSRFALRLVRSYMDLREYDKAESLLNEFAGFVTKNLKPIQIIIEEYDKKIKEDKKHSRKLNSEKQKEIRKHSTWHNSLLQANFIQIDLKILTGKLDEAKKVLEDINKVSNNSIPVQYKLGNVYYKLKKFNEAEDCFKRVLLKNPENAEAYNGLSLVYMGKEQYLDAANAALDAVGLNYYFPFAHFNLGQALFGLKDYENAANAYEVSVKMVPGLGMARNKLIELYTSYLNKPELASTHKQYFEKRSTASLNDGDEVEETLLMDQFQSKYVTLTDPVVIVSGLPRSGTSMMMQMLEAGGVAIFTDDKRTADDSNPKGYYEHEDVKNLARDKKWMGEAVGKAVKVISHLLIQLPAKYNYKVLFMVRDLSEVIRSQHKMLVRQGKHKEEAYPVGLELAYKNQLKRANEWLKKSHNAAVLYIEHQETLKSPREVAIKIQDFLGKPMNIDKMVSVVDKTLYHEQKV